MNKVRKRKSLIRYILLLIGTLLAIVVLVFMHFGGFDTGESADPEEFLEYAGKVNDISIPEEAKIIALGEVTHGNKEFQQLKLDVFRHLVDNYGVRAFALEGDYGGCEKVNRYIHGGEGSVLDAVEAIGFAIYRTNEMMELISFMRQYNDRAAEGEDLYFYGFDMQRYKITYEFLLEACQELSINIDSLEKLMDNNDWNKDYDYTSRIEVITHVKAELAGKENSMQATHFVDMLLQFCKLEDSAMPDKPQSDLIILRDKFMAENIQWIAEQERKAGYDRIFVTGHNGHVARWGSYDSMGKLLDDEIGESYYVIGTDFYRTDCNLPRSSSGKRINRVFYSHDPLAKAARTAGLDICWLDFAKVSESSLLSEQISEYSYMGSLGEGYAWYMRLLPPSYRIFQPPSELYDGMIFVAEATPIKVVNKETISKLKDF